MVLNPFVQFLYHPCHMLLGVIWLLHTQTQGKIRNHQGMNLSAGFQILVGTESLNSEDKHEICFASYNR